jgi:SAM-dependent methyltransferase
MPARNPPSDDAMREEVRALYAAAARAVDAGSATCCGPAPVDTRFGPDLYGADEHRELPDAALAASLGCGNPIAVAELVAGETVLDLGSGGGIDVILSARRVGPTGRAFGLDMTDEMLDLARRNAAAAGLDNVEFLKGDIEDVPLPDAAVDVVISNCVINLSVDKPAVFAEMSRVLRPGGRVGVSDVVAEDRLTAADRAERGDHAGCIAGALSVTEYEAGLRAAGFEGVSVTFTHEVADGLHGAIIRATKPADGGEPWSRQPSGGGSASGGASPSTHRAP